MKYVLYLALSLFTFGSCVEIIDDITIRSDGTGTFKYAVNLSASKLKINSILALDSLDGKKVPSLDEVRGKIDYYKDKLSKKEGITNVKVETNFTDFILKFQCDFQSVQALQKAIKEIVQEENKDKKYKEIEHDWLTWDGTRLVRSVPDLTMELTERVKQEDAEALKQGNYTTVTRFDRPIEKFDNPQSQLSPNKMALMVKTSAYSLIQNMQLLENTIYLSGIKK